MAKPIFARARPLNGRYAPCPHLAPEPLLWEVRFLWGNGEGIEALAKPIFARARPLNGRYAPCPHLAPEPLLWEVRFLWGNGEGIEALAKPIFVRAQPFYGSAPRTLQWRARPVPASRRPKRTQKKPQSVGGLRLFYSGVGRNRTDGQAFAEPCLTTWLPRRK